jgi:hypothetical protein
MGSNRTTVKAAIVTQNVPTVTNADLTNMLNVEMNDNLRFRLDVVASQSAGSSATCNFTGKEKIILTTSGPAISITISGVEDGDEKWLFINKSAGETVTFISAANLTPVSNYITNATTVLYQIQRKGSVTYVMPWLNTVRQATDSIIGLARIASVAEHNALSSTTTMVVPGRIPLATSGQKGLIEIATTDEARTGSDTSRAINALGMSMKIADELAPTAWIALTMTSGMSGNLYYFVDAAGNTHIRAKAVTYNANMSGEQTKTIATLPGHAPDNSMRFPVLSQFPGASNNLSMNSITVTTIGTIALVAEPDDYGEDWELNFELMFRGI